MSLLALKKIGAAATIAACSTYAGAVCYGLTDESMKAVFMESIPGYSTSIVAAGMLREGYGDIVDRVRRVVGRFRNSTSHGENLPHATQQVQRDNDKLEANIRRKYRQEIDRLKLQVHNADDFAKSLEKELQQKYDALIAKFQNEMGEHYDRRLHDVIKQHDEELSTLSQLFFQKVGTVTDRQDRLEETLVVWNDHRDLFEDFGRISLLLNEDDVTVFESKDLRGLLARFAVNCKDAHLNWFAKVMLASTEWEGTEKFTKSGLLQNCSDSVTLAKEYAGFANDGNLVWFLMPFCRIGNLSEKTQKHLGLLSSIEDAIAQKDLRKALLMCNLLEDWPRVMMKPWMRSCRHYLELLDAASIVQNYLLSSRLQRS
jgi:hypothetical protein